MSLEKIQQEVDEWAKQFKDPYWKPLEILAHLAEEQGELAKELSSRFGPRVRKPTDDVKDIEDEIGDILFTLICLANSLNINMNKAFRKAMDKCYNRDNNRYKKNETSENKG